MIKKIIFPLLAIILLASCANKFSLVKRKYNKGFYVSRSHSGNKTENSANVAAKEVHKPAKSNEVSINGDEPIQVLAQVKQSEEPSNNEKAGGLSGKMTPKKEHKQIFASAGKNVVKTIESIKPLLQKESTSKKGSDADTNKILLVILALFPFICLIAIYLHDGKKVTLNFWITLLLHLTFVLWLVFALLVVLDVIDLR